MVCLDEAGQVVRPALLWNDTRSAGAAADLIEELGGGEAGRRAWAEAVGTVPVASFTVTKLRWLAEHEPDAAKRTAAVALPHDWLSWRLAGGPGLDALFTDRGDASGTGYWSAADRPVPPRAARPRARPRRGRSRGCSGRPSRAGRRPTGSCSAPAPATTPRRRWGSAPTRATSWCRSARPGWRAR